MLEIKDLRATVSDKEILRGINLTVGKGEVHAVMGPNGSGKSTLAQVLAGHPAYTVTGGSATFEGENLLEMDPEVRAQKGVFLAFQYPVEIPGVSNAYFLRTAYNEIRKARGEEEVDPMDFLDVMEQKLALVEMNDAMLNRSVNTGFSGGEKKRNEILQMAVHFQQFEIAYEVLREFLKVGNEGPKIIDAFGLAILRMPVLPKDIPPEKRELVALAGQAGLNMAARRFDRAKQAFDTLLSRYPDEPNVHYSFGVFELSQDADAALKEFQRALELMPLHQPAMVQMAFEYLKRNDYDQALPLAEKAVELDPKMYPARNVLGRVLLELGQTERAVKELEEGVRLAPTSPEMHFALARAYTRIGRKEDAQKERETFKRLQDEYERQRNTRQAAETDRTQDPAKP